MGYTYEYNPSVTQVFSVLPLKYEVVPPCQVDRFKCMR
jgi:hypothetical protein